MSSSALDKETRLLLKGNLDRKKSAQTYQRITNVVSMQCILRYLIIKTKDRSIIRRRSKKGF
ncbi:uncharacterized protein ASCRUDRAFT_76970 [Ascoidea rubescens DSM 1968]|uniref:Uncharacterized protein n=1 Tax=Ascoidea rubescens DSM 1968 TaxID=1344418 RepID=A0A1D2VDR4_9ASCO|nr:hypothetical protein ASCRUDRAFT_76970 [Ascoidea rubescens DSM 1968]ODV59607.1 hypothetical protein ASCRUDRAFT_76970 [Ascoidea rubescens DSM 1968]